MLSDLNKLVDINELFRRAVKYAVEGVMVALAAYIIPVGLKNKNKLKLDEILLIALTATATFAVLDTYAPSIGSGVRTGAGFGIGANMVKFPGGFV
jgi:hypothetical protein